MLGGVYRERGWCEVDAGLGLVWLLNEP
jgi:hypothetical protein